MKTNMKCRNGHFVIAACALMLFAMLLPAAAQAGEKPPVDQKAAEILDKYIEVTGGKKAYEKIDNRYAVGTMEMPGMGITFSFETWAARPDKSYQLGKSAAVGEMESGSDGETFWESSMMTGPRIYEGGELDQQKLLMRFDKYAYWREVFDSAVYVGEDSVDGALCDMIIVTAWNGKEETLYFDRNTNLLTRVSAVIESQMGNVPLDSYFEEYREVDGIIIPFVNRQEYMGIKVATILDSVAHNVEIADSVFALPPKILELMKTEEPEETE